MYMQLLLHSVNMGNDGRYIESFVGLQGLLITKSHAEIGGMLMYYGGDAIEILLIVILCYQLFKSTGPREVTFQDSRITQ